MVAACLVCPEPHGTHWASTDWNSQTPGAVPTTRSRLIGKHRPQQGNNCEQREHHLSHIPATVYRCCTTGQGSGLIMDTYREGDAKSLERAGTEREENGIGGLKGKVSFREAWGNGELGMPRCRWVLLI